MRDVERDKFDPLDELLATARWPELSRETEARLHGRWEALSGGRRPLTGWLGAVAAALVVGIGVWVGVVTRPAVRVDVAGVQRVDNAPARLVPVRDANAAEVAVVLTAMSEPPAAVTSEAPRPRLETLEALLRRDAAAGVEACLAMVEDGREDRAVEAVKGVGGPAIDALFARLDDRKVDARLAAARLLGRVDGAAVTRRLAAMVGEGRNRREALAALMQSDGAEARQYVARVRVSQELAAVVRSVEVQLKAL